MVTLDDYDLLNREVVNRPGDVLDYAMTAADQLEELYMKIIAVNNVIMAYDHPE